MAHKPFTDAQKRRMIEQFAISRGSSNEFARLNGIGESTFRYWLKCEYLTRGIDLQWYFDKLNGVPVKSNAVELEDVEPAALVRIGGTDDSNRDLLEIPQDIVAPPRKVKTEPPAKLHPKNVIGTSLILKTGDISIKVPSECSCMDLRNIVMVLKGAS